MFTSNTVGARGAVRKIFASILAAAWMAAVPGSMALAQDDWTTQFADAFKDGEFDVAFRYRYEFVDAAIFGKDANASTLRTRLVFKSAEFKNVFLTLNMDDIHPIVVDDYNSTRNNKTQYPVVPDPKGTDLNLASLTWTGLEDGELILGRQRIKRANDRFVGNVGWRQNEQTYDALAFKYSPLEKLDLFYSYVDRVKRVFGPEAGTPTEAFSSNTNLLDAAYTFSPAIKLFGYVYLMEFKNSAANSNQTIGIRATGDYRFGNGPNLNYQAELATQQDYKNSPFNYDANYMHLAGTANWERFGFTLGYEVLEGNGTFGNSFKTPLATLHKFNGWADQFLVTPDAGLEDLYIAGSAKFLQGDWQLIFHQFSANTGSADWGDELDFSASWKFGKYYSGAILAAFFDSDQWAWDTDKVWLQFTADF